jgi:tRNA (cmo5U34)-methyltransferase
LIVSVIGFHHQNDIGKKKIFRKIFAALKPGGYFLFADLVTYKNKQQAALNHAKHFKYLVDHATDEKTLSEWAFHHLYLNQLASIENQIKRLQQAGFKVEKKFLKINTALLVCKK